MCCNAYLNIISYESLKKTLYDLQTRLLALTGQDPLKDKLIGSQLSPSKLKPNAKDSK